jgi:hypothetical protein
MQLDEAHELASLHSAKFAPVPVPAPQYQFEVPSKFDS